jgi:hypothetical protein
MNRRANNAQSQVAVAATTQRLMFVAGWLLAAMVAVTLAARL